MKSPHGGTRSQRRRSVMPFAGVLAVVVLALTGCFGGADPNQSTPTGEKVAANVAAYYSQVLLWSNCGSGAQCTTVRAPRDWDTPSAVTDISLAVVRHRAKGAALGSLFVNPGGPGASGYDLIYDDEDFAVSATLLKNYDVVGWDPRGVGRSAPVTCYNDEQLDEFIYGLPSAPENSPEWVTEVTDAAIDFGQACLERTGPVLEFVDTQSTVRDLDLLRALVGDEKLNYLGYSYGTEIGMYYIDRYPQKVGRMVLDGAIDSTVTSFDVSLTQSIGFERALQNWLTACPQTDGCPFSGDLAADLATIRALYDQLDASPIAAADGRLMDAGVLDTAMSMALYSQDSWPYLNDLYGEVLAGGTETAFLLSDYYYSRDADGVYTDNSLESFIAINCLDYAVDIDPVVLADQHARLLAAAPTTTRASTLGDVICENWPFSHRGDGARVVTGQGAAPVLVISTTGDPATPYEWGVALAEQLESAELITYNGEGHTAYNKGVACVDDAVDDYFTRGTVPKVDPNC